MEVIFGLLIAGLIVMYIWDFIPASWEEYYEDIENDVEDE
jgi:hypothetical protein